MIPRIWIFLLGASFCGFSIGIEGDFELRIVHMNDLNSKLLEITKTGEICQDGSEECIGGAERYISVITEHKSYENSIFLFAGNVFNAQYWVGPENRAVISEFIRRMNIDAMTLGLHDFDGGIDGLNTIIESHRVIVSNMEASAESRRLNVSRIMKSTIIEFWDRKIGIIGAMPRNTREFARTGMLRFSDEVSAIMEQAEILNEIGVFTNILLCNCGYEKEKEIARNSRSISVIVGGDPKTFLYNGKTSPTGTTIDGPYPTVVKNLDDLDVLIVQGDSLSRYIGNLVVVFDSNGKVKCYSGNLDYVGHDRVKDYSTIEWLESAKAEQNEYGNDIIGRSEEELSNEDCKLRECSIGNLITDSMMGSWIHRRLCPTADIALYDSESIKASLKQGEIKIKHITMIDPYENSVDCRALKGKEIRSALLHGLGNEVRERRIFQVSGLHVEYNVASGEPPRASIKVIKGAKSSPLENEKKYYVLLPSYLSEIGGGFPFLKGPRATRYLLVGEAITKYINKTLRGYVRKPAMNRIKINS